MRNLIISFVVLIIAIFINNGILIKLQSDSDSASIGVILLLGSLIFAIIGIRKYGKDWKQGRRIIIQIVTSVLIIFIYLFSSALQIYSKSKKSQNEDISTVLLKDNDLTNARNLFIAGLNKTLAAVGEQSNGFYSIKASYENNEFSITYKLNIENDISINDEPIDALVKESIKAFKENGTIKVLKDLDFHVLKMTYQATNRENSRRINLDKIQD